MIESLTEREREIVLCAAEGLTDKEIANRLNISESTVRSYWERLRPKLNVANRTEAAVRILRHMYQEAEDLRQGEAERFHAMVEALRDYAIYTMTLDRIVLDWNPGVLALTGFAEEEWVGRSGDVIFTEEDRAKGDHIREAQTALEEGRAENERWHKRKDGSRFWGSGIMVPLKRGEKAYALAKIFRDETRRKLLEEQVAGRGGGQLLLE